MASRRWAEVMHQLPASMLTPAEKAEVCYYVIMEETVAEKKLEKALEVLRNNNLRPTDNYKETIASLFKLVISYASKARSEVGKMQPSLESTLPNKQLEMKESAGKKQPIDVGAPSELGTERMQSSNQARKGKEILEGVEPCKLTVNWLSVKNALKECHLSQSATSSSFPNFL